MKDLMDHKQAAIDAEIKQRGHIRLTHLSFQKLFFSEPFSQKTDAQIGRAVGVPTATIKAMRRNMPVSTDDILKICSYLHCQPGDFMEAGDCEYIPAKDEKTPGM